MLSRMHVAGKDMMVVRYCWYAKVFNLYLERPPILVLTGVTGQGCEHRAILKACMYSFFINDNAMDCVAWTSGCKTWRSSLKFISQCSPMVIEQRLRSGWVAASQIYHGIWQGHSMKCNCVGLPNSAVFEMSRAKSDDCKVAKILGSTVTSSSLSQGSTNTSAHVCA